MSIFGEANNALAIAGAQRAGCLPGKQQAECVLKALVHENTALITLRLVLHPLGLSLASGHCLTETARLDQTALALHTAFYSFAQIIIQSQVKAAQAIFLQNAITTYDTALKATSVAC